VEADNDELIAVAWDAKYRTLGTTDRWAAGYLYQAHAFRDALAVKLREEQRLSPVCWSIVLHPGPGIDKFVSQRPNDWPSEKKGGRTFELVDGKPPTKREDGKPRPGGVAMFALTPGHHTDPRDKVHLELLRAAVETAKRK
jgi:hypothetical protein